MYFDGLIRTYLNYPFNKVDVIRAYYRTFNQTNLFKIFYDRLSQMFTKHRYFQNCPIGQ